MGGDPGGTGGRFGATGTPPTGTPPTGTRSTGTQGSATATMGSTASGSTSTTGGTSAASGASTTGAGGAGGEQSTNSALTALLARSTTTWTAATTSGATSAAQLELASGQSVIAIGGWDGSDPAPTLAQFQQWVADGKIHYFIAGGGMGDGMGGNRASGTSSLIATWVAAHFTATTVGGQTVYDLTATSTNG